MTLRIALIRGSTSFTCLLRPIQTKTRTTIIPALTRDKHTAPDSIESTCFDCPELPNEPSWSLSSIMEREDSVHNKDNDITEETIEHLINLAHLHKPSDPSILHELERDVRRMRNFLDYIQSCNTQILSSATDCSKPLENLRSLVDDGAGLQLRPFPTQTSDEHDPDLIKEQERQGIERREILLKRSQRTKGNFFVVGAELDPKAEN